MRGGEKEKKQGVQIVRVNTGVRGGEGGLGEGRGMGSEGRAGVGGRGGHQRSGGGKGRAGDSGERSTQGRCGMGVPGDEFGMARPKMVEGRSSGDGEGVRYNLISAWNTEMKALVLTKKWKTEAK